MVSDSAGRIWFSLRSGLSVVDSSQITDYSVPALPHIEAITADNNAVNLAGSVRIPPSPRRITFEYTGLSLAMPGRIRFRYFLEDFDNSWSQPVAAREAVYTNLGPGSYRFRLVASNSEGLWNGPETAIALNVAPAYYQTTWFRSSLAAVFVATLWGLYRLRLYQLAREFSAQTGERARIARDLHDTLLQSFQASLIQMQTARNIFPRRPEEGIQTLDNAIGSAEQAIDEGRRTIQDLRATVASRSNLEYLLTVAAQELAEAPDSTGTHLVFGVTVEGSPRILSPALQDEVYRIGREVLRNAFRHAHASHIEAEIRYDKRHLRLRIRDDGKGIDRHILEAGARAGHWGLPGIRERSKRIGGRFEIWSEAGAGTEIQLTVPASMAYAQPQAQRRFGLFRKKTDVV